MTVVDILCECGHAHEGTPVELIEYDGRDHEPATGKAWRCEPDCIANRSPNHFLGIDAKMIAQNRIFAVVYGDQLGNQRARRRADAR
jgi:hypothetical protein